MLVAEDLAPADTAGLDPEVVHALVTEKGGPTSHTAIIARQLGIPCVVGTAGALEIANGTRLLVDGTAGTIETEPGRRGCRPPGRRRPRAAGRAGRLGRTRPHQGRRAGQAARQRRRRRVGPQGGRASRSRASGLFRTELCFLDRQEEPSVEEQADIYAEVLEPFGEGQYVVVRTLDAGSDKPVAFATLEGEENPALGVRGLRLSWNNPAAAGPPARRHRRGGQAHRHRDAG